MNYFSSPLNGASIEPEFSSFSTENFLNGTFQKKFESYFAYKITGRELMTRFYNQILFTFFRSTDNINIQIGKSGYLYEEWYPRSYLTEIDPENVAIFTKKLETLLELEKKLKEREKGLLVVITPSKASVYPEYLPSCYKPYLLMKNKGMYSDNFYDFFIKHSKNINLKYLDLHDMFINEKNKGKDIFTKYGTHWSASSMVFFLPALIEHINKKIPDQTSSIEILKEENLWGKPFYGSDDLESLLNLAFPKHDFFTSTIETVSYPSNKQLEIFLCGGSFSGHFVSAILGINGWINRGETIASHIYWSWYNTHIVRLPDESVTSSTTDNFDSIIENDLFIIEFNEQYLHPSSVQFLFIENFINYLDEFNGRYHEEVEY